jgi:hypothetical protein
MELTPTKTLLKRPTTTSKYGEFFGKLFHSRNVSHLVHLNVTSFAKHKALNEYYDGILDLLDTLIETSFGSIGRQEIIIPEARAEDINKHLSDLKSYIESNRSIFKESNIQNIIDEIVALIDHTKYLLTLS